MLRLQPQLRMFDDRDGEAFKVSDAQGDGKALRFTAYMPSIKWRSWHRFTLTDRGLADHELTIVERWKRVRAVKRKGKAAKKR